MSTNRAGTFIAQPSGYQSFKPSKLPPVPSVKMSAALLGLLSTADRKLGRLDGITQILPNPDLFVAMYVNKEAVLSSQIEGTQASLIDVLENEPEKKDESPHVEEIVDYVRAMNHGLSRLDEFPLSLRLIKEIHGVLLEHGRGSSKNPGEFRASQNWLGPAGCTLQNAVFVPPAIPDMIQALNDLESFFYDELPIPVLIKIALIHAQFETIHPFLDGNGRVGRLLITFWLCHEKILEKPLLYLSYYFKQNRQEYYDRLMDIRLRGNWEGWIDFFLKGVAEVSDEAISSAKQIIALKEKYTKKLYELNSNNGNYQRLLEQLFESPTFSNKRVSEALGVSFPTAMTLVNDFVQLGILKDITPNRKRDKRFRFSEYIAILQKGTELA